MADYELDSTAPFRLTFPDDKVTIENGEALVDMTSFAGGAVAATSLAVSGGATVGGTLGVTGATTLAAASATTLAASTSLTVTGATVVGLEVPFVLTLTSLTGAPVYRFTPSVSGTIVKIVSNLQGALTTGDATITGRIGATAITNGVVTITQAASAPGDVDTATPTALNTVVANTSDVNFTVGGTNLAVVGAVLTVVVRRSA